MKITVPKIRRVIVDSSKRSYGVTIAFTEDLERGLYTCAFSFLDYADNHCKAIGRQQALDNFAKGITHIVDANLDIEDGTMDDVGTAVISMLNEYNNTHTYAEQIRTEKEHHFPRWLDAFLYNWWYCNENEKEC